MQIRRGKNLKDRFLPLGERAAAWLHKYLADVRPTMAAGPDEPQVFVSYKGTGLSAHYLTIMVRRYLNAAGVAKPGACHSFRHTMATEMLDGGADVRYVQEMLGHAHLNTTQIYTRVSIAKLQAIHRATHPAAKLERSGREDAP